MELFISLCFQVVNKNNLIANLLLFLSIVMLFATNALSDSIFPVETEPLSLKEKTDPEYKLRLMKTCVFNYFTVVALQKRSTYTQFFRDKIGLLQQTGITSHWRSTIEGVNNNYMRPYFQKLRPTKIEPKKISLQNLGGAFWLLLGGHFIAYIVFVAENFLSYQKKLIILVDQNI